MNEIKFVKFSKLEEKKYIERKFPGIKGSDLIYIERIGKFCDAYIVTEIASDGLDFVSSFDGEKGSCGMDEKLEKALNNAPEGFTIYSSPASSDKKEEEAKLKETKPEEAADPEAGKFEEVDIIRKCGHKEAVKIKKTSDKEYRAWLIHDEEKKLCRSCWEEEAKENAKKAKKAAKESGLPALKGSAKQKKWAETIRAEKLAMLAGDPTMGAVWAWYAQNYTKAAEWIDARFMNEQQLKRNMEQLKKNMEMKLRFKR